jgi:hypothetical protein
MLKPVCVPCGRFFKPKKTGTTVIEGMPVGDNVPSGIAHKDRWAPYKLWMVDLWECAGCGAQILVGSGRSPLSEQHKDDFAAQTASYNPPHFIYDC